MTSKHIPTWQEQQAEHDPEHDFAQRKWMQDEISELRAALDAPTHKMVPVEPTPAMVKVGTDARWQSATRDPNSVREIWAAMLKAVPAVLAPRIHQLYSSADEDAPAVIRDGNGAVVLSLCKVCGQGEGTLENECPGPKAEDVVKRGWLAGEVERRAAMQLERDAMMATVKPFNTGVTNQSANVGVPGGTPLRNGKPIEPVKADAPYYTHGLIDMVQQHYETPLALKVNVSQWFAVPRSETKDGTTVNTDFLLWLLLRVREADAAESAKKMPGAQQ